MVVRKGRCYVTQSGLPVEILGVDADGPAPCWGKIWFPSGRYVIGLWSIRGINPLGPSIYDLEELPANRQPVKPNPIDEWTGDPDDRAGLVAIWLNCYRGGSVVAHTDRRTATRAACDDVLHTIPIVLRVL